MTRVGRSATEKKTKNKKTKTKKIILTCIIIGGCTEVLSEMFVK
jgi:hypothetical protein